MTKALLSIAAAAALLTATAMQPARADGGATAAIIIGVATVSTVACESHGGPLCVLSPLEWARVVTGQPRRGRIFINGK